MAESKIVLRAENITKLFGGLRAIDDATIYLKENEILGLIGNETNRRRLPLFLHA